MQMDEKKVSEILEQKGMILYELHFFRSSKSTSLKVFIHKKENEVNLNDCEEAFKSLSFYFDSLFGPSNYHLEVSSPGLERKLKKDLHFKLSLGKEISFYFEAKKQRGKLIDFKENKVFLDKDNKVLKFPLDKIRKAKVEFFKKRGK